jgi:hypothetical protein
VRRILIAVLAVAVLGTAVWLVIHREAGRAREAQSEARLLRFDARSVKSFDLVTGDRTWSFARDEGGWRIVAPFADAANASGIESFLSATRQAPVVREVESPGAPSEYGLDPPVASLRLHGVDAPVLDLGDEVPTGEGLFAKVGGRDGILLVGFPDGKALLRPDPNAMRDRTLTGMAASAVEAAEVESAGRVLALEKGPEGWWLTKPNRLPASDTQVDRLLKALERIEVAGFVDDASPTEPVLGLGRVALSVTLRGGGAARTVRLGAAADAGLRFASRDDRSRPFVVKAEALAPLGVDAKPLVETRLTKHSRYAVVRFAYRARAGVFEARREGKDEWKTASGDDLSADEVYAFLVRVLEAGTSGFEIGASGGGRPDARFDCDLEGGGHDRIDFFGDGRARVASVEHVTYRLATPVPPLPAGR